MISDYQEIIRAVAKLEVRIEHQKESIDKLLTTQAEFQKQVAEHFITCGFTRANRRDSVFPMPSKTTQIIIVTILSVIAAILGVTIPGGCQ